MSFSYDVSSDVGKVRMLIPDRDYDSKFFEDEEIEAFLGLEESNIREATALALETMASDQAMVLKVIRLMDLTTDGQKTSQALLERAKLLREQALEEEMAEEGGAFDIAEWVVDDFSYRNRLWNEMLRDDTA
jgi:hypothetical protein